MVEYLQGIYQQDIEEVEAEISLAEAKLKGAEQSIGRSNRLPTEADTAPAAGRVAGEKAVERAKDALGESSRKEEDVRRDNEASDDRRVEQRDHFTPKRTIRAGDSRCNSRA